MNIDTVEDNIKFIEVHYSEETRKNMISRLLECEEVWINGLEEDEELIPSSDIVKNLHTMLDRIFGNILKNLNWKEAETLESWDFRPLEVMKGGFPQIEKTVWFKMRRQQILNKFSNLY